MDLPLSGAVSMVVWLFKPRRRAVNPVVFHQLKGLCHVET